MRTFAPIFVRGEEHEGVKFWGFGKQVYQEILSIISDPDYGDITDLTNGRDIVVEFRTAEESGKTFPETTIRVKPNSTPAVDPKNSTLVEAIKLQTNILDLFPEMSYDELKDVMDRWLNPESSAESADSTETTVGTVDDEATEAVAASAAKTAAPVSPTAAKSKGSGSDDVTKAFDDLFNS